MKLDDIANLLAEKINQAHYIKHYLNEVFIKGFQKGNENKGNFAIDFLDWYGGLRLDEVDGKSTKELLEIYKNK